MRWETGLRLPEPRSHHVAFAAPWRDAGLISLVVHGGGTGPAGAERRPSGDFLALDSTRGWHKLAPSAPLARSHHAVAPVDDAGNELVLVGGWDGSKRTGDVVRLGPGKEAGSVQVTPVECSGQVPTGRSSHTLTRIAGSRFVMTGRQFGQRRWSDVHHLDLGAAKWTEGGTIKSRAGHAAVHSADKDCVVVFGGRRDNLVEFVGGTKSSGEPAASPSGRTVDFDKLGTKCAVPAGRQHHSVTKLNNRQVLMFGGMFEGLGPTNELYGHDLRSGAWYKIENKGDVPPPLCGHTATLVGGTIYVVGGEVAGAAKGTTKRSDAVYQLRLVE